MSNPLRNPKINYRDGWFFVTMQVANNKSVFGAITADGCALNELGRRVAAAWTGTLAHFEQIVPDAFVVMPNHVHAALLIKPAPANRPNELSHVVQCFKSFAAHQYLALLKEKRCVDNGAHLWQTSFYDEIITDSTALANIRRYIQENPARWDDDRFGPVTAHAVGNLDLLNQKMVAFVASEGWHGAAAKPRCVWSADGAADPRERQAAPAAQDAVSGLSRKVVAAQGGAQGLSRGVAAPPADLPAVISTFTSPEERAILAKCLAAKRPFIRVMPGGIPAPLPPEIAAACAQGWGLVLSPAEPGVGINKQRAIWCNRYVISQAKSVWCGALRPGGTLETLLTARFGRQVKQETR